MHVEKRLNISYITAAMAVRIIHSTLRNGYAAQFVKFALSFLIAPGKLPQRLVEPNPDGQVISAQLS
jgi:hypothetical protein